MVKGRCIRCNVEGHYNARSVMAHNYVCSDCKEAEYTAKKQAFLDKCKSLSIEERLAQLEEWMFEHSRKPHKRDPFRKLF